MQSNVCFHVRLQNTTKISNNVRKTRFVCGYLLLKTKNSGELEIRQIGETALGACGVLTLLPVWSGMTRPILP